LFNNKTKEGAMTLNKIQTEMCKSSKWNFSDLQALFLNCTLKRSPDISHTQGLIDISQAIMEKMGVLVEVIRPVEYNIAYGVWPDMKCTKVIERLYSTSGDLNEEGQYAYYGRVGGCLITGNEDGAKHCSMNILYSLQHLGYVIPPQADAAWLGEAGPGPSYLDPGSGGPENDFTNRNTTFMTWNLMHLARMIKDVGGIPAHGNQRSKWEAGCRFDYPNPEYR
jgi:multimeric flavodoxin WrbA